MNGPSRAMEVRVGAFVLAALLLLAGFYVVVGNPVFGPGVHLQLEYAFSGPIKPGATIKVSGVNVGKVDRVEFVGQRPRDAGADFPLVRLHVFIEQRAAPLLTQGTRFYVTTLGVLGEHYVDILPGPANATLIADGATVRGVDLPRTDLLMARMAQMVDQVGRVLDTNDAQLEHLLGAATQLMKQADVLLKDHDVGNLLQDAAATMTEVRGLLGATRKALKDPEQLANMVSEGKVMLGDMHGLLTQLKTEVPATLNNANHMLGQAEQLSVRVDGLLRALEKAGLTDEKKLAGLVAQGETVMERADRISARADVILLRLEKGEGTAGKLMKDDAVYNDLKALLSDIRANPWKLMIPGRSKDAPPAKKDGE
jgi:phospholipid/cholesterol/gamma-HCH transport system substrate-binding protein